MSRVKLILSIFLMLLLLLLGIVLPSYYRKHKEIPAPKDERIPVLNDSVPPEEPIALDFLDFDGLETFFSSTQIESLKTQFSSYFQQEGLNRITSVSFLKDKTDYSGTSTVQLQFALSDHTILPVSYDTSTGVFFFGEDQVQVPFESKTYPKQTDDSLPDVTTEDIENRQEGGYPDVTAAPSSEEDTLTPPADKQTKEVQP